MSVTQEQILAGQAVYTTQTLNAYDFMVLGVSNRFIWKCPTQRLLDLYNSYVSANHLDVGVGTGYFLDRCKFPAALPRIALMDLNQTALAFASRRIAKYKPEIYHCNVLDPIQINTQKFDSISLNYLLHCLPGDLHSKAKVFDHLKALMNPQAVMFGATLLHGGVERNGFAKLLMSIYNRKGIFANQTDHLEDLTTELKKRFVEVSIETIGCAAVFCAKGDKS